MRYMFSLVSTSKEAIKFYEVKVDVQRDPKLQRKD